MSRKGGAHAFQIVHAEPVTAGIKNPVAEGSTKVPSALETAEKEVRLLQESYPHNCHALSAESLRIAQEREMAMDHNFH